jgi:hypothetical protein
MAPETLPHLDVAGHFGDNLARCRKLAGLSQDEVSDLLDGIDWKMGEVKEGRFKGAEKP